MAMDRRRFLQAVSAGACVAAAGSTAAFSSSASSKPNIVLCMADDQGWGDMAYNGNAVVKTPHFDKMAKEALRFDRFYAAAPVCSPTRGSVMTGRHPNRFGCFKWGHTLRPQERTVAEALKDAGYVTGHFGKWHLGPCRKPSPVNPGSSGFDEWLSAPNFFDNDPILSREGKAVQKHGESSMVTVDAALDFIRKHADSPEPFLAVVWFGSPHRPHRAAEKFRKMYPDQSKKMQNFYGEITGMDYAFGKLRNGLRNMGIHEDTILWYCSDNGGLPEGKQGGRGHKGQVWEGGLRVPGILEWPGHVTGGQSTDIPCCTTDIYPTVVNLVGAETQNQPPLDGVNLTPLLKGTMKKRPKPIGFWDYPERGHSTPAARLMKQLDDAQQAGRTISPETFGEDPWKIKKQYPDDTFPGHSAWLDWPWKLHRIERKNKTTFELYNLEDDPKEKKDLADSHQNRTRALKGELESWLKSVVRSLNGEDY